MKTCTVIEEQLGALSLCEETPHGSRVSTHCLYPSFDRVDVFVRRHLDGFLVTDAGQCLSKAWLHGRDYSAIRRSAKRSADHFGCEFVGDELTIIVPNPDWLSQGIITVANAAAQAATEVVSKVAATTEQKLVSRVRASIDASEIAFETSLEYLHVGKSGKTHRFDLLAKQGDLSILIDIVVPHPNSIAAKYLGLSDTEAGKNLYKYALFDRDLAQEDRALLSNVADLLPIESVVTTRGRSLLVH